MRLWKKIVSEAPSGAGFHIHVAEHECDEYDSLQKYGKRVIDRLNEFGALGNSSIVVHGVHVDAREMAQLAETGTWVTHQPRSNMNNGVGVSEVEAMLRMGIRVGLGMTVSQTQCGKNGKPRIWFIKPGGETRVECRPMSLLTWLFIIIVTW